MLSVLAFSSFGLCLLLTPLLRGLAARRGWLDAPDSERKLHRAPVPRIGGVPVAFASLASVGAFLLLQRQFTAIGSPGDYFALQVVPASLLILITGTLDDLLGLKPSQKLAGQCAAALLVCVSGLRLHFFEGSAIGEGLGAIVTFCWLVACSNAFNLIDGVDGLASGLGFIGALTMLFVALSWNTAGYSALAASMAGALFAFLLFNLNPASIFLGDSGSLWTGFMLGCFGLVWFQRSTTLPSMAAPVIALAIPLLDTSLSIVRRFVSARRIFQADRGHIHHRLIHLRGPRSVVPRLFTAAILASLCALILKSTPEHVGYLMVALFCVGTWIGVRTLAYEEFTLFGKLIREVPKGVRRRMALNSGRLSLTSAPTPEECWFVLLGLARDFELDSITLELGGHRFQEQPGTAGAADAWSMEVSLSSTDYLRITRSVDTEGGAEDVMPLVDMLHSVLSQKATQFMRPGHSGRRRAAALGEDLSHSQIL
ncbi:MAG TPA: MraY family glycosyltransferase [Terriglobia bacterium]|nr:MraY family glycosyltransferase [Terriglobia bacterium]